MKPNLIITGASGLLGQYLCRYFSSEYNVVALYNSVPPKNCPVTPIQIDLTQLSAVRSFFSEYNAAFVIHTAGLTSVDSCEQNPDLASKLNVEMTSHILQNLDPKKSRFVHISSDHLFSGEGRFYSEDSKVNPINTYARTKYEAENLVTSFKNSVVIRTNFYGGETLRKRSFSNWIYNELMRGNKINVFDDIFFTPISVHSLAENIEKLMNSPLTGIYNIAGSERISKLDFALKFADYFGFNRELIIPSKIKELSLEALRPQDMSLSTVKIQKDLPGFVAESLQTGFSNLKQKNLL